MSDYLPFIVVGLTTGSVYALAATGLVLTYKTSRIFNFAHGSMATVVALLFLALVYRGRLVWGVAAALAILVIAPLLGTAFEVLGRRLSPLSTEAKILATIGLILFIDGAVALWGDEAYSRRSTVQPPQLPGSLVRIGGVNIGVDQIIIVAVGLVAAGVLHLVVERSSIGRSMRAVVDNPVLLGLVGRSPRNALRVGWALGIGFVGLSGLLLVVSPSYGLPVGSLGSLVLQAFGAAAIGGFTNLPLTYVGGLAIGVIGAVSTKFVAQIPLLMGLPVSIPFLVLFLVLILRPGHLAPERTTHAIPSRPRIIKVPRLWKWPIGAVFLVGVIMIPTSRSVHLIYVGNVGVAYAMIFLGLGLLVRTSGQVSLCQLGLAAVGATTFVRVADGLGWPWFGALAMAGLAAAAVGVIVAIPAIRVAGIYLALATFGFGALLEDLVYPTRLMFSEGSITAVPRPVIGPFNANDDVTFFFVCLSLFAIMLVAVLAIRRTRLGRLLRALGDSPVALATLGTSINITRVAVFSISAFLAGVGGGLIVSQERFLVTQPFASTDSLTVVAVLLTLRLGEPLSSLLAAGAFVVIPSFLTGRAQVWWLDIGFGAAALIVAIAHTARWVPRWQWVPAVPGGRRFTRTSSPRPLSRRSPNPIVPTGSGLEVRDLTIRFQGLTAVDGLELCAPLRQITGLIGPNGAGKTTTFNYCSGLVPAVRGRLLLNGRDLSSMGPAARARHGLGRTFQRVELFESLTVRQNVALGYEGGLAGVHLVNHVVTRPSHASLTKESTATALELVGIEAMAERDVDTLSTSEKRLVELARCLAGDFVFLLLDEPSSGLDASETRRFGLILQRVVAERGIGVLLVEHNMPLVRDVCSTVHALDFGHLIYSGKVAEALESAAVRRAYLGVTRV
jgi:ABC-type branched-subunit amino acid transport system ATPase component/branched-subunit amino acid ABC-type transport system permease component